MRSRRLVLALLVVFGLVAAACGDSDDDTTTAETTEAPAETTEAPAETTEAPAETTEAPAELSCGPDSEALTTPGQLTVATGEPVFPPWMIDDDPSNGQGFESAVVYAVAEQLGFTADQVTWVRTGFDEAIAPGDKDYDFNIQQYSITEARDEVVDFSRGYYVVEQALVAAADSDLASATSLADLTGARLGAAVGTTSLDYIDQVIQPDSDASVYDDNAATKAAFDAGQVDGLVYDLPTAYYITAVEIPDASIVGVLPRVGDQPEQLGMLFAEGSPYVSCVDGALDALFADGTIDALEDEWLNQGGSIPSLDE